jgi:hypothetical protein
MISHNKICYLIKFDNIQNIKVGNLKYPPVLYAILFWAYFHTKATTTNGVQIALNDLDNLISFK